MAKVIKPKTVKQVKPKMVRTMFEDEQYEYKKGGQKITFMSEKQIKEFLAAGGELEFI